MDAHAADVRRPEREPVLRRVKDEEEEAEIARVKEEDEEPEEERQVDVIREEDVRVIAKLEEGRRSPGDPDAAALSRGSCEEREAAVRHAGERLGAEAHCCSACRVTFLSRSAPAQHAPSHAGCSACGKGFSRRMNMAARTGEKPFACAACDVGFGAQSSWLRHVRSHAGAKPFACGLCAKRFTRKVNLKEHATVHAGEKPFSCSVCDDAFSFHSSMLSHRRTHAE